MENSMTKISDLPMNGGNANPNGVEPPETISISSMKQRQISDEQVNYQPINVHPNPYGISDHNPIQGSEKINQPNIQVEQIQPPIQDTRLQPNTLPEEFRNQIQNQAPQNLPSRDIPMNTQNYQIDANVQPNHIPEVKVQNDFVKEHYDMTEKNLQEYEAKKKRENKIDFILDEIQMPIFVGLLFFLFQTPVLNTLIFKKFSFMTIYNSDGNFNFNGLFLKSLLFGSFYMFVIKSIDFITNI